MIEVGICGRLRRCRRAGWRVAGGARRHHHHVSTNGAGKSSLLKAVSRGLVSAGGGVRALDGASLRGMAPEDIVRKGICHVPESRRLFPYMSVLDNLLTGAHLRQDAAGIRDDLDKVFDYFPVLKDHRRRIARELGGGQQQMIAIGRGIMSRRGSTCSMNRPSALRR